MSCASYDPREQGAKCDICPLKGSTVVPPEANVDPIMLITERAVAVVGEAPSEAEESQGRPFSGPQGMELDKALRQARIKRRQSHVTTVILCKPPGKRLKDFLDRISRYNRKQEKLWSKKVQEAKKAGEAEPKGGPDRINSPLDCCAPRLEKELEGHTRIITMGTYAYRAVTGMSASLQAVRGGVMELEETDRTAARMVMPTLSPSFVLAVPRWSHVFRNDIHKAGQWFRGETEWVPPNVTYHPSADELAAFLAKKNLYTYDIETDGIESLTARIRCIGIGDGDNVMIVGFLGVDGHRRFYDYAEEQRVKKVLSDFFADPTKVKAGHNSGMYDKLVIRNQWGVTVEPNLDTILLHRCVESELPHSLGFVGSMYTIAPSWKQNNEGVKLAWGSQTDDQLHAYCADDVCVTARVIDPLVEQVRLREQTEVFALDTKMQAICADMHEAGMYVDQGKRLVLEKQMLTRRHELLSEIRDRLEWEDFNPGSVYQVRDILFGRWKLEPPLEEKDRVTESGDPSTADLVLRSLLSDKAVKPEHREIIKLLRYYRKVQKTLGTYVTKLRPWNMRADLGWDDDEDWNDRETRKKYGEEKKGIVNPRTGRMYPGYNGHVTTTGRLSSSKPLNAQNFPKALREMVIAQPGHVLVGADMDQLELRIAAARWEVELYLKAFEEGKDPHSMTAFAVFGDEFCKAAGLDPALFDLPGPLVGDAYVNGKFEGSGDAKKLRDLSKAVQYASQYMATVETVHKLICKTEIPSKNDDGTTELPYALLPLRRVRQMRDNWLEGAKEFETGWESEIARFRNYGYLREPIHGRRRDFLDGENPNEIVNFPIQSQAAALMNNAIIQLHEQIPLHKWGPGTGIINQCHDSIVVECPENEAENVARLLEECMNQEHEALPRVKITATASIGKTWKEVG